MTRKIRKGVKERESGPAIFSLTICNYHNFYPLFFIVVLMWNTFFFLIKSINFSKNRLKFFSSSRIIFDISFRISLFTFASLSLIFLSFIISFYSAAFLINSVYFYTNNRKKCWWNDIKYNVSVIFRVKVEIRGIRGEE